MIDVLVQKPATFSAAKGRSLHEDYHDRDFSAYPGLRTLLDGF
jgi:hypothetical protein